MIVSVIVCTRNCAYAIVPCLDSIAAAISEAAPIEAEIVVVNNGSSDDTDKLVLAWAASQTIPSRLLFEGSPGLSKARNCGLCAARGDIIVFTDDDCRLSVSYIKEVIELYSNDSDAVLRGGRVELGDATDLPLTIKTDLKAATLSRKLASAKHGSITDIIVGCNMTMRREVIDRIGLFDECLGSGAPIPGGEDIDYILRAYLAYVTLQYVPTMVVYHHHGRKSAADGKRLQRAYAIASAAVYSKYFFKNLDVCRPLWWDFKKAFNKLLFGAKDRDSSMDMRPEVWMWYSLIGVVKYYLIAAQRGFSKDMQT